MQKNYMDELDCNIYIIVDEEAHMPALRQAIMDNHLENDDENSKYSNYSTANKGCSVENPFVINEASSLYVPLERYIIEFIFTQSPYRECEHKQIRQRLQKKDGKVYDCLEIEVTPYEDFLADFDEEEEKEVTHMEEYWFDITTGYTSISNRCR